MSEALAGRVVALIGTGSERDRAIAVALAGAGANIAIATERPVQEQEFATASIANEVWAIGREQFSAVIDASDDAQMAGFLAEARTRLGRLDAMIRGAEAHTSPDFVAVTFLGPAREVVSVRELPALGLSDGEVALTVVAALDD